MAIKFPIWGVKQSADGHKLEKLAPGVIGHEAVNVSQLKPNKGSAINIADNTAVPPTEVTGDIYILDFTTGGVNAAWDGASAGDVVEFDGALWQSATPTDGDAYVLSATGNVATYIDNPSPQWTEGENLSATYISNYFASADHGDDANTGLSELNAFETLAAALDAGEAGGVPFAVHLLDDSTYEVTEDSGTPGVRTTSTQFILLGNSSTLEGQAGGVVWKVFRSRIDGMNAEGTNLKFSPTGTGSRVDHAHSWYEIKNQNTFYETLTGAAANHRWNVFANRIEGNGSVVNFSSNVTAVIHIVCPDITCDFNSASTEYAFIASGNNNVVSATGFNLDMSNAGAGGVAVVNFTSSARGYIHYHCQGGAGSDGGNIDTGATLFANMSSGATGGPLTYNDNGGAGTVYDWSWSEGMNFEGLDAETGLETTDLVNIRDLSANKQVKATIQDIGDLINPDTFYSADGTLSGNRIVTTGTNTTTFRQGAGSGLSPSSLADNLVLDGDNLNVGMSILTAAGGNSNLFLGEDGNSDNAGRVQYVGSVNELRVGSPGNLLRISDAVFRVDERTEVRGQTDTPQLRVYSHTVSQGNPLISLYDTAGANSFNIYTNTIRAAGTRDTRIQSVSGQDTLVVRSTGATGTRFDDSGDVTFFYDVDVPNGTITGTSLQTYEVVTKAFADSPYSTSDGEVVLVNATGGNVTVNLPAAVNGAQVNVKKTDASANTVTIDGAGGDTIDGSLTAVLTTQYENITLVSDGSDWFII